MGMDKIVWRVELEESKLRTTPVEFFIFYFFAE